MPIRLIATRNGVLHYRWDDAKSGVSGDKIAAVAEVKNAGWIVGSGSWEDEFTAAACSTCRFSSRCTTPIKS
ncbi:MAG: cache domain-containing protein [Rivihabitans pingtungensis]